MQCSTWPLWANGSFALLCEQLVSTLLFLFQLRREKWKRWTSEDRHGRDVRWRHRHGLGQLRLVRQMFVDWLCVSPFVLHTLVLSNRKLHIDLFIFMRACDACRRWACLPMSRDVDILTWFCHVSCLGSLLYICPISTHDVQRSRRCSPSKLEAN